MKRAILAAAALLLTSVGSSHAATVVVSNVTQGVGDTLFATTSNVRMTSGIVTVGYFPAGFDVNANLSPANWANLVANFTIVASGTPGSASPTLEGSYPGYVEEAPVFLGSITVGNPLLGRMMYGFVGGGSTLIESISNPSHSIALFEIRPIADDVPFNHTYQADPTGRVINIGRTGTFVGDAGGGPGTYNTLILSIPEPSVAFLGGLSMFGFLRRRR